MAMDQVLFAVTVRQRFNFEIRPLPSAAGQCDARARTHTRVSDELYACIITVLDRQLCIGYRLIEHKSCVRHRSASYLGVG